MAASSSAVAPICASAAAVVRARMVPLSGGRPWPLAASTSSKNIRPNGNPNRKRTWVAPTVPRVSVNSFCCALRNTCPPAARTVNTAHNHDITSENPRTNVARAEIAGSRPRGNTPGTKARGAACATLEGRFQAQVVHAIDRLQIETAPFVVLQDVEGNDDPCPAQSPHLAVEIGEPGRAAAVDADDHVALL